MIFKESFFIYIFNEYFCSAPRCAILSMERRRGTYYIKGVTVRFGFDVLELRKFKQIVKNKATGTPYGMFIYITLLADILRPIKVIIIYSSAWGFRRCSFRQSGQCEGLYTVERATELAPRFFYAYTSY